MLNQLKSRPFFFTSIGLLLIMAALFSCLLSKSTSFIYLNGYHSPWLDNFFIQFTFLGDGLLSVFAVLVLLVMKRWKEAVLLLVAFLSSGLLSCLFKNLFSLPRPKLYFEQMSIAYSSFIEGTTLSNNSSFPSGHTTSAFAMATVIALVSKKKATAILVLLLTMLVGYSRIYLGQHFLQDVVAGAFLGTGSATACYYFIWQKGIRLKLSKRNSHSINNEISPQWNSV